MKNIPTKLEKLLSFKTVSGESQYKEELERCKSFLGGWLQEIDFEVSYQGKNKSIILAERLIDKSKKTLLIYGHYDVQPAEEPEWKHNPFEPRLKNKKIYSRGVSDNKGQFYIHIRAIEELFKDNSLNHLNLVFLLEGEEEIGSPTLKNYVKKNKLKKDIDSIIISDSPMMAPGQPTIIASLRGNISFEIEIKTVNQEVHSGMYGGAILSPVDQAMRLNTKLFNKNFLEKLKKNNKRSWPSNLITSASKADKLGFEKQVNKLKVGERSVETPSKKVGLEPALIITEINTGSINEKIKNSIPSKCVIKYNYRTTALQDIDGVWNAIEARFNKHSQNDKFEARLKLHRKSNPVLVNTNSSIVKTAMVQAKSVYKKSPILKAEGGSISIVDLMKRNITDNILMFGFADLDSNLHGPNENMRIANIKTGIKFSKELLLKLGR